MIIHKLRSWLHPQQLVRLVFRLRANREFIVFKDRRLTRGQTLAEVEALAAGLQALGVRKGDKVATLLPACPEAVYTIFLPAILGTVNVPLNPLLGEHELRHILAHAGASVVITTGKWYGRDYAAMLARLLPDLPDLRHVIVHGASESNGRTVRPLSGVTSPGKSLRRASVSADDDVLLSYTSGTTGRPKAALHTQSRYWGILLRFAGQRLDTSPLRCLLLPYPPYHYGGLLGIVAALLAGGKVVLMDRFDPQEMLDLIQREKVTQIGGTPTMYRWMLRTPGQERYDLSSVQRITFSSEPMSYDLAQALYERLQCNLENFYGTTESMLISWTRLDDSWERAATTVGRPVPGARLRIVDDERRPLPVGARGEVAAQTSQMMIGYYRDAELTAQVLDEEGWFYTGDIGYLGEDGYLRLVDRKNDLIIRGGENVYPAEIEHFLESHPLIRRAGVIGATNQVADESIWAFVEPQPGATLDARDVLDFCRSQIAPFKIPAQVRFVEQLPTTAVGKVQKFRLREMAAQESNGHGTG